MTLSTTTLSPAEIDEALAAARRQAAAGDYMGSTGLLEQLLEQCPPGEELRRARALVLLAHNHPRLGNLQGSARCASEALALCERHHDDAVLANALSALSYTYSQLLLGRDALECGLRAQAAARRAKNRFSEAWALNRIGVAYTSLDNQRQACDTTQQALDIALSLDGAQELAFSCLNNLAYCWLNRVKEARRGVHAREGAAAASQILTQSVDQALALSMKATQVARESGSSFQICVAVSNLVEALLHRGEFAPAGPLLNEFEALARQHGYLSLQLQAATQRALILMTQGEFAPAVSNLQALLAEQREHELPPKLRRILIHALYEAHKACEQHREALSYLEQHVELERQIARDTQVLQTEVMAIRQEVDRAQAQAENAMQAAERERERARRLEQEQQQLRAQAVALDRAAHEDVLTGLNNRRHVEFALPLLVEGARQSGQIICLAMLDVDHFKRVNDDFGHGVGDVVLQQLAQLLRSKLRGADLMARVGGEEFMFAMLGLPVEQARTICERVRVAVAAHDWHLVAPSLGVRVSIGVAFGPDGVDSRQLIDAADNALYTAKRAGRDRVELAPLPPAGLASPQEAAP